MFTGLVQGEGEVAALRRAGAECRLRLRPLFALPQLVAGESIAVNGACLSVETFTDETFTAYASAETLARTTLGALRTGERVNLERALALGDRLGGHLVSGHVDGIATVLEVRAVGQSLRCRLRFPPEFAPEVIPKGSVALDGISLTVNDCGSDFLEVNVIPDTRERTSMRLWRPGTRVNMETDLIGKYVRRVLCMPAAASAPPDADATADGAGVTRELLLRNGFI
ncbi:riboflavin synthase [Desulfovibrio legallii]|jgi:riboflavin synthase|uniref:Riboflavin synthase n=1 Tax=Desulfovibrio legallii TaxID=571438 RepID=A0A1G7NBN0_9BACT|nr:riboflavin synthase [Desulfovibrio legallii]SDF71331.1 riboflavin synthase alpha chain [Desulfovibrio legallii]